MVGARALNRLIITADDFGLSEPVNAAIEAAHRRGILSAASLMVGAPAAADAVARARALPTLRVGLHLVLVDGDPVADRAQIPKLLDSNGRFRNDLARYGAQIAFSAALRRQIETEITAQFEAYRATGLPLDHVDGHPGLLIFAAPTRAREAHAPAGRGASAAAAPSIPIARAPSSTGSSRLDGAAAAGRRRRFHFSDFCSGQTMELGRSGRSMMMMTSASASGGDGGVAGSLSEVQRPTGSSTAIAKFCSNDGRGRN
jgi:hypothetical protein